MGSLFRVVALVGILILATTSCQQGKRTGSASGPKKAEASLKATKTGSKTSKTPKTTERVASKREESKAPTASRRGTLTAEDNGTSVDLRQGQIVAVALDSNRASGLSWFVVPSSSSVMVREGSPSYAVKSGSRAGGVETWRFRAAHPGHQEVKLEYRRKWAQSMPERTFRFEANVR